MAINLKFPMKPSSAGAFDVNSSTIDAVVDDLKILLLSNHGERPIHGDFGANLRSVIFSPEPTAPRRAEDLVLSAIEKWMPFVKVLDITVANSTTDSTVGQNELRVKLKFEVGQIEGSLDQRIRN